MISEMFASNCLPPYVSTGELCRPDKLAMSPRIVDLPVPLCPQISVTRLANGIVTFLNFRNFDSPSKLSDSNLIFVMHTVRECALIVRPEGLLNNRHSSGSLLAGQVAPGAKVLP